MSYISHDVSRRDSLLVIDMPDINALSFLREQAAKNDDDLAEAMYEKDSEDMPALTHAEEYLFDVLSEGTGKVYLSQLIQVLNREGLRNDDIRLKESMNNCKEAQKKLSARGKDVGLDRETFTECVSPNVVLIKKAYERDFVIPQFITFVSELEEIFELCKQNKSGKVASYIPQLARADPECWGVSICTIDGQRHSFGDVSIPVCLQSNSMPLTYALALNDLGEDEVHKYIGHEPSGGSFNELKLDSNNKPHNPLINAGAIVTVSLLKPGLCIADRFDYISQQYKRLGGGEFLGFNNAVYLSERATADRNRAIAHYMQEKKCFPKGTDLQKTLDFYFQLCSVEVTCESASVIAATLANGGLCPMTGEEVLGGDSVRNTLALMHSCGMYDHSGQFAFKVGLPAKSGVSGLTLLVIPNVMGIALWSPPLNKRGISVRGIQFCEKLVDTFNFHKYDNVSHSGEKHDPRGHKHDASKMSLAIYVILAAASSGDIETLRRMYLSGADMSLSDYDGRTALHLAAAEGHLKCIKFLLDVCNVPYNLNDRWDHTAWDEAKTANHSEVEKYLQKWANDHSTY